MKEKKTTNQMIEDLAISVQKGFLGVDKKLEEIRQEMEYGFKEARQEMKTGFKEVNERLDRIESTVNSHDNRLDKLEDSMLVVKTKVGIR